MGNVGLQELPFLDRLTIDPPQRPQSKHNFAFVGVNPKNKIVSALSCSIDVLRKHVSTFGLLFKGTHRRLNETEIRLFLGIRVGTLG